MGSPRGQSSRACSVCFLPCPLNPGKLRPVWAGGAMDLRTLHYRKGIVVPPLAVAAHGVTSQLQRWAPASLTRPCTGTPRRPCPPALPGAPWCARLTCTTEAGAPAISLCAFHDPEPHCHSPPTSTVTPSELIRKPLWCPAGKHVLFTTSPSPPRPSLGSCGSACWPSSGEYRGCLRPSPQKPILGLN